LWIFAPTPIQITVKDASIDQIQLDVFAQAATNGYPSTLMRISAYAKGLNPDDTHLSRD
jgi:hypothetical protein